MRIDNELVKDFDHRGRGREIYQKDFKPSPDADAEMSAFLKDGWRIVSTTPINSAIDSYTRVESFVVEYKLPFTRGIMIFMEKDDE